MLNLNDREWKPFFIGDLFIVKRPKARSEKGYEGGKYPFVASGNFNNGVIRCCEPHADEVLDKGNCITVSPVDGSAFYQNSDFLGRGGAGSSVLLLYCDNINEYSGLFLARLIRQTCSKYCYGKMGNQDSIKREKILLPITADDEPDFAFMEQYIKEREDKLKQKYIDFIGNNWKIGGAIPSLENTTWAVFNLKDLFNIIQRGKRLVREHQQAGTTPYVSSTAMNNGVDGFISTEQVTREFSNCLTIANSGSVGSSFYQPSKFIASDHITHLKNDNYTMYVYMFIATMTKRMSEKYNFNREINDYRISREKILLPTANDGNPDYEYMEQYIKSIMYQKYAAYLEYQHK